MSNRPRSVTVISWIFIAFGSIALLTSLLPPIDAAAARSFRSQHPFLIAYSYLGVIVALVCGIFMLRRRNWARWVWVGYFGSNVASHILESKSLRWFLPHLLFGLVFAVAIYFLFRPQATAYFQGVSAEQPPPSKEPPSERKVEKKVAREVAKQVEGGTPCVSCEKLIAPDADFCPFCDWTQPK